MATTNTTCQICGRPIQAKTGVIAHHGYRRPDRGSGWQTSSCFGARFRPYEIACDAIQPAIDSANSYLADRVSYEKKITDTPPEKFDVTRKDAWGTKRGPDLFAPLPDNFDTKVKPPYDVRKSSFVRAYEDAYWNLRRNVRASIQGAEQDIAYLSDRLKNWRAP